MKVYVYSKLQFDQLCQTFNWNDTNVPNDVAIVSICCTEDCKKGYLEAKDPDADDEHWFKYNHDNVINLNFDDIIQDEMYSNGFIYRCITAEQAKQLHEFIKKHIGKDFIIHCRAGKSRSAAVGQFLIDCYNYTNGIPDHYLIHANSNVLAKLKRCFNNIEIENYK